MNDKELYKTELITDFSKFNEILKAIIYNFDDAEIRYIGATKNEIRLVNISEVSAKGSFIFTQMDDKAYSPIYEIYSSYRISVSSILSIQVLNNDNRNKRIEKLKELVEKRKVDKNSIYTPTMERTLFNSYDTNYFDNLYKENAPRIAPLYSMEQFHILFKNEFEGLHTRELKGGFPPIYRRLFFYLHEFKKYTFPKKQVKLKNAIILSFIDAIYTLSAIKYFDNYFKQIAQNRYSFMTKCYENLGKEYILEVDYSETKMKRTLKRNIMTKGEYKRFSPPVLKEIYSNFASMKTVPNATIVCILKMIYNRHSIEKKVFLKTIEDYYIVDYKIKDKEVILKKQIY
ncbi:hypothetical protein [Dysgonomonas sp. 520]|uniref:hypothetical protein n=1 Tax=Dysgonomonas sp. 520 TaxID=2302931 RepID=UPI0013D1BB8A|nr:hypothetical protein [Dysgonomonas sp. 520]NDW11187.1 hypothetical protein [Dysgonomonas sp. 520]